MIGLTDENGVSKTTYVYDAFGNVTTSGEATDNPFQFMGRENDGIGLYYYRLRNYSPEMQRFVREDPFGLRAGINYYSAFRNNPIRFIDPLGLWTAGIGGTVNVQWGPVTITGSAGVVIDGYGHVGVYYLGGGGLGVGAKISGGVSVNASNAKTICDLSGPFNQGSLGGGWGPNASGDYFTGNSPNGWVYGGGVTVGAGLGAGGSSDITWTEVTPIGSLW